MARGIKHIKVLKDLADLVVCVFYRHLGPTDLEETVVRERLPPVVQEQALLNYRGEAWRGPVPRERIGPISVVCDRLITNGSESGDLDLQKGGAHP